MKTTIEQADISRTLHSRLLRAGYSPSTPVDQIQITQELLSDPGAIVTLELLQLAARHSLPVSDAIWSDLLAGSLRQTLSEISGLLGSRSLTVTTRDKFAAPLQRAQALLDLYHSRPRPKRGRPA